MKKIMPKFIFARYNEDISWLNDYPNIAKNSIVYNKGEDIDYLKEPFDANNLIKLSNDPNFGREGDTYLTHIINNYNNLDKYTIFAQGDPFTHNQHFVEVIEYLLKTNTFQSYQALTSCWKTGEEVPPASHIIYDKTNNCGPYSIFFQTLDSSMRPIGFRDAGIEITLYNYCKFHNIGDPRDILKYTYDKLNINKPFCGFIKFNYAAIFGVAKNNILQNPVSFYRHLRKFVLQNKTHGFILERFWYTILS